MIDRIRGRPICHHFHKRTLGGRGWRAAVRFLNVDYDALHFHTKINIFKVLFWEGGEA